MYKLKSENENEKFKWSNLGDISLGRENLGGNMPVEHMGGYVESPIAPEEAGIPPPPLEYWLSGSLLLHQSLTYTKPRRRCQVGRAAGRRADRATRTRLMPEPGEEVGVAKNCRNLLPRQRHLGEIGARGTSAASTTRMLVARRSLEMPASFVRCIRFS